MKKFYIFIGIFIALAASRFIPHPPNFTSLIALSFYVPAIFGVKFIPFILISFVITDLFIGFHSLLFFTWGSVVIIGFISKFFSKKLSTRILGTLICSFIFFFVTNFGVWVSGVYGYSISSLINTYIIAIPFFGNTLIATVFYTLLIELISSLYLKNKKFIKIKNFT